MAGWPKRASKQKHNGALGKDAKVTIRENVLAELGSDARVFDGYCGPVGEMHKAVWHRAASYVGVDVEWRQTDARRRFVAEVETVLRAVDLTPYNIFDFDAFGSPWSAATIWADRRAWEPGERGALVITSGLSMKLKYASHAGKGGQIADLGGLVGVNDPKLREMAEDQALWAVLRRANVVPVRCWRARGNSNKVGGQEMLYVGVIFVGAAAKDAPPN